MSAIAEVLSPKQFPNLAALLGEKVIRQRRSELERVKPALLWQLERDLALLGRYVPKAEITRAYRGLVGSPDQLVQALYEIRAAAMLAPVVEQPELAPAVGRKKCDFKGTIAGHAIFVEVTKKEDLFPFERGRNEDITPIRGRVTVEAEFDPTARQDPSVRGIPASQELRERVREELGQLPAGEISVLVVGTLGGRSLHVEEALHGDELVRARSTGAIWKERAPNGLFEIPDEVGGTSRLAALVWMKLVPQLLDIRVHSRLFVSARAAHSLPPTVEEVLREIFDRRWVLERELRRITELVVERYQPEKIVLFGSLAEERRNNVDRVHQWSDLDLFIVKQTPRRYLDRAGEIVRIVEPRVAVNLIVYTPEELERAQRERRFFITGEVLRRGQVLYP